MSIVRLQDTRLCTIINDFSIYTSNEHVYLKLKENKDTQHPKIRYLDLNITKIYKI